MSEKIPCLAFQEYKNICKKSPLNVKCTQAPHYFDNCPEALPFLNLKVDELA